LIESPSEEEEEEEEEKEGNEREYDVALFIKKFNKFIKKKRPYKGESKEKSMSKGCATITVRMCTSLPNVHRRGMKKTIIRERSLTKGTRRIRNTLRRSLMVKPMLIKNGTQVMRVLRQKVMMWQS
jgi:hypothetical protein